MKRQVDKDTQEALMEEHGQKCLFPERWESIKGMAEKIDAIHDRLFVDNGHSSHQTRLTTLENKLSLVIWVFSILGGSGLVGLATIVVEHFRK